MDETLFSPFLRRLLSWLFGLISFHGFWRLNCSKAGKVGIRKILVGYMSLILKLLLPIFGSLNLSPENIICLVHAALRSLLLIVFACTSLGYPSFDRKFNLGPAISL
jgi:hypothetical protein